MLLISHSAEGWSLTAGVVSCTVQCWLSASPRSCGLRAVKKTGFDGAHVIVDYSGGDLTKLSVRLGNFCIQY